MIKRRADKTSKKPSAKARKLARDLAARGSKPFKRISDVAFGSPEAADELLEAIRESRRESGEPS